jgi:hypothetical protein
MASITSLGFNIFTTYNGRGLNQAQRNIIGTQTQLSKLAGLATAAAPGFVSLANAASLAAGAFSAMAVSSGTAGGVRRAASSGRPWPQPRSGPSNYATPGRP